MRFLFLIVTACLSSFLAAQNVGIGTTSPHTSAALEVQSNNKGMLVPRVALTAINVAAPISSPADALLVYNTASAGSGNNVVVPGFYFWNATAGRWTALAAASNNTQSGVENAGFGTWGDCASAASISGYNPVAVTNGLPGDEFGSSISISGNWAIIGAPKRDVSGKVDQGAAYLFFFNGTSWTEHSMITAGNDGGAYDYFGSSVSISGNYAVVGAHGYDDGAIYDIGAAYTFFYNGSTWVIQEKLTAPQANAYDQFGISVAISGQRMLIGAHQKDIGSVVDQGAVYPYYLGNLGWVAQTAITGEDVSTCRLFGRSLSISGNRAIIGAVHSGGGLAVYNSAYIFSLLGLVLNSPAIFVQSQKLFPTNPSLVSAAAKVAIAGNIAALSEPGSSNTSKVRLYSFANNIWTELPPLSGGANFGHSIALAENKILVGMPGNSACGMYVDVGGIWEAFQFISPPAVPHTALGAGVAMDGKRFAIGDYGKNNLRGMVYFGKIN